MVQVTTDIREAAVPGSKPGPEGNFAFGNEPDDGELYDDYNSNETEEPFTTMKTTTKAPCAQVLHLRGPTNMKPIRCTKCCGFRCYKVEDNIACYNERIERFISFAENGFFSMFSASGAFRTGVITRGLSSSNSSKHVHNGHE
ncbi:hypothetical protein V5799_017960 [Amblyomma americanum]|uniref:Evasin n=1 Tax=Amblyomma americanum TaxID=6943 RepID=A0AAQ4F150_AMBAM